MSREIAGIAELNHHSGRWIHEVAGGTRYLSTLGGVLDPPSALQMAVVRRAVPSRGMGTPHLRAGIRARCAQGREGGHRKGGRRWLAQKNHHSPKS